MVGRWALYLDLGAVARPHGTEYAALDEVKELHVILR